MEKGLTKEEYFRSRLEQLRELSPEELNDRVKRGQRASAMTNTDYWAELKAYLQGKIESYKQQKLEYSIVDRYMSEEGQKNEIAMIQYEAQITAIVELLDHICFHVDDGKLAIAALKLKSQDVVKK
jgi:hypothetical protein